MHEKAGWIVWNFEYKPPHFDNKDLALSVDFLNLQMIIMLHQPKKGIKFSSIVIVYFTSDVVFLVLTF
jgi:hypothetical protein